MDIIIPIMILIGGFSKIYRKFIPLSLGIELKTFITVLLAQADWNIAFYSAIAMIIISAIVSGRICHWIAIKMMIYSIVIAIASGLAFLGIKYAGIVSVLFLNFAYIFTNIMLKNSHNIKDLVGNVLNVVFNGFLFINFGEVAMSVIT